MIDFLAEYGLFFAKVVTIVIAIIFIFAASKSSDDSDRPEVVLHCRNTEHNILKTHLTEQLEAVDAKKKSRRAQKKEKKLAQEAEKALSERPHLFIIEFDGDIEASAVDSLREQVTAILTVAKKGDKVLILVESAGGIVFSYGLAASQLLRLKHLELDVVVAVDKIAASGGYLMASTADTIIAAPFAVIGSIGVVAQLPNFHRALQKHDIDVELHTAGKHKRTLTMFGENTDEAREKFRQDLDETHTLFKQQVMRGRPQIDIEKVSTGEYWYGTNALELGLVDELKTSDEYILSAFDNYAVYDVDFEYKLNFAEKIKAAVSTGISTGVAKLFTTLDRQRYRG